VQSDDGLRFRRVRSDHASEGSDAPPFLQMDNTAKQVLHQGGYPAYEQITVYIGLRTGRFGPIAPAERSPYLFFGHLAEISAHDVRRGQVWPRSREERPHKPCVGRVGYRLLVDSLADPGPRRASVLFDELDAGFLKSRLYLVSSVGSPNRRGGSPNDMQRQNFFSAVNSRCR
jgi:hypothetical protein